MPRAPARRSRRYAAREPVALTMTAEIGRDGAPASLHQLVRDRSPDGSCLASGTEEQRRRAPGRTLDVGDEIDAAVRQRHARHGNDTAASRFRSGAAPVERKPRAARSRRKAASAAKSSGWTATRASPMGVKRRSAAVVVGSATPPTPAARVAGRPESARQSLMPTYVPNSDAPATA